MKSGSDPISTFPDVLTRPVESRERYGVRSAGLRICLLLAACIVPMLVACTENDRQVTPDPTHFQWPVGVVADPVGPYVYVISTNFDSASTGGTVVAVDSESLTIVPDSAAEIGSFGGEPFVSALADGRSRIWIPVRDNDSLDFVDISYSEDTLQPSFSCSVEEPEEDVVLHKCSKDFRVALEDLTVTDEEAVEYFADNPYGGTAGAWLKLADGRNVHPVYVAGITGSVLNIFLADDTGVVEYGTGVVLDAETHSVLEYKISDSDRVVWISNQTLNEISVVKVHIDRRGVVTAVRGISTSADLLGSSGAYFRGMARSTVGPVLYAAFRSPPSLAVFEIDTTGMPLYRGIVPLDGTPSSVATFVTAEGREIVYVTESTWSLVYAIDPVDMTVIDQIFVGKSPYGIAVSRGQAFVTNFEDSSLSVISVNPESDDYHTEIAQIK